MPRPFDLLLSPHPDDVVYSAFSILSDGRRRKVVATPFNVSRWTRLSSRIKLPKQVVSAWRTTEDRLIMAALGTEVHYMFLPDTWARSEGTPVGVSRLETLIRDAPVRLIAPLGVGGHPDHIIIRDFALGAFQDDRVQELILYEDLPYSAVSDDLEAEESSILLSLGLHSIRETWNRLEPRTLRSKLFYSRMYFSQNNKADLLARHAARQGAMCGAQFAERCFSASR